MVEDLTNIYMAEFAFTNTQELAEELLIQSSSETQARKFAEDYAANLGVVLFRMMPATEQQVRLYQRMGKFIVLNAT